MHSFRKSDVVLRKVYFVYVLLKGEFVSLDLVCSGITVQTTEIAGEVLCFVFQIQSTIRNCIALHTASVLE